MKRLLLFLALSMLPNSLHAMNLAQSNTEIEQELATDVMNEYFNKPHFLLKLILILSDKNNHQQNDVKTLILFFEFLCQIHVDAFNQQQSPDARINNTIDGDQLRILLDRLIHL